MIQAVIFDKDGLMFDTEPLQFQSFRELLAEYGREYTIEDNHRLNVGKSADHTYSYIQREFGIKDIENFKKKRRQRYRELSAQKLTMFPGLLKLLKYLHHKGYKLAVASGTHLEALEQEIAHHQLTRYFDCIISSEHLPSKPAPDVFLKAAEKLQVLPNHCLVLEDSQAGVEAAKAAGMQVVAIPNDFTKHQDFSLADKVAHSLTEIPAIMHL